MEQENNISKNPKVLDKNKNLKNILTTIIITFLATTIGISGLYIGITKGILDYFKNDLGIDYFHIFRVASICNEISIKDNPGSASVTDGMLSGFVASYNDKYGLYVPRELSTNFEMATDSSYTGMGIIYTKKLNEENEYFEISEVSPNTPAEKAGLKVGDKIYYINDISVKNDEEINKILQDVKEGKLKKINLIINETQNVTVKIEKIEMPVIETKIENEIAKLKIFSFAERTSKEVIDFINKAEEENVKGYLIDLRDDSGGDKNATIEILERFVKEGLLIKEVDKNKNQLNATYAKDKKYVEKPIVILVNEKTASASELLSMSLQDLNNAKLVGQKTFGKSTILTSLTFPNGSSLVISSGYYLPQSERYIEEIGITPDYETEIGEEETKGLEVLNSLIYN